MIKDDDDESIGLQPFAALFRTSIGYRDGPSGLLLGSVPLARGLS